MAPLRLAHSGESGDVAEGGELRAWAAAAVAGGTDGKVGEEPTAARPRVTARARRLRGPAKEPRRGVRAMEARRGWDVCVMGHRWRGGPVVCLRTKLGLWKAQPKAVRGSLRTSAAVSDLPAAVQRRARKRCAGVGRRAVTQISGRLSRRPRSNYICSSLPLLVYPFGWGNDSTSDAQRRFVGC